MEATNCLNCKKELHLEAKKCPHCLSWQSKWMSDMQNPKTGVLYTLIIALIFGSFIFLYETYEDYKDTQKNSVQEATFEVIEVLDTKANYYECDDLNCMVITGYLNNPSDKIWTSIYFHVEYFDSNNNLIDNHSEKPTDLLVQKNSKTSFKLAGRVYKDKELYVSHKVTIKYASGY